ncbi:hypothetical protein EK21DRAFT_116608 [Setomelanomma holmii]|uniref:Uncharacterized protein n=1 Tax=Setomelanomma holmii TaxID=210430 RepID=A0A9P4LJ28_9PLEO|nr:hypothetical protein EK21DRAFT_116608 [Setomelanomma holmii]
MLKAAGKQKIDKQVIAVDEASMIVTIRGTHLGKVLEVCGDPSQPPNYPPSQLVSVEWVSEKIDVARGRTYVKLDTGYEVWAPRAIDLKDEMEVVLLVGARTPFVLRRQEKDGASQSYHELIGDCYVNEEEVMNGNLINQAAQDSFIEFRIA